MGYQPNVVSKGDVVEINGCLFKVKNDFNRQRDSKLKLEYFGDVVAKERYYKGMVRKLW